MAGFASTRHSPEMRSGTRQNRFSMVPEDKLKEWMDREYGFVDRADRVLFYLLFYRKVGECLCGSGTLGK